MKKFCFALLLFVMFHDAAAFADITRTARGVASSTSSVPNVTIAATASIVVIASCVVASGATPTVLSVTYDSVGINESLTKVPSAGAQSGASGPASRVEVWAKHNSAGATTKTLSVSWSSACGAGVTIVTEALSSFGILTNGNVNTGSFTGGSSTVTTGSAACTANQGAQCFFISGSIWSTASDAPTGGVYTPSTEGQNANPTNARTEEFYEIGATATKSGSIPLTSSTTSGASVLVTFTEPAERPLVNSVTASGYQTAQSTYNIANVTCGGSTRYLIVGVSMLSVAGSSVTSVTHNGVALTPLGSVSSVTGAVTVALYGLIAPATGAQTVAVTLSTSVDSAASAVCLTNVQQTQPTEAENTNTATNVGATDATVVITTVTDNALIAAVVASDDTAITASQTSQWNTTGALGSGAGETFSPQTPAGAKTMGYTAVGAAQTWSIIGVALRPSSASGTAGRQTLTTLGAGDAQED